MSCPDLGDKICPVLDLSDVILLLFQDLIDHAIPTCRFLLFDLLFAASLRRGITNRSCLSRYLSMAGSSGNQNGVMCNVETVSLYVTPHFMRHPRAVDTWCLVVRTTISSCLRSSKFGMIKKTL